MPKTINRVFLDLDGVIANFTKSACRACNVEYPKNAIFSETWLYDKIGKSDMWDSCRGTEFWENIEMFPWGRELVELIEDYTDKWIFLTKPSIDPGCYSGKFNWVQKHFGNAPDRLWLANTHKSLVCRGPGDLLIDDKLENGKKWTEAGGTFFHWAELSDDHDQDYIDGRLNRLYSILRPIPAPSEYLTFQNINTPWQ